MQGYNRSRLLLSSCGPRSESYGWADSSLSAHTALAGSFADPITDGRTFTISNGGGQSAAFEFDSNGTVNPGHTPVTCQRHRQCRQGSGEGETPAIRCSPASCSAVGTTEVKTMEIQMFKRDRAGIRSPPSDTVSNHSACGARRDKRRVQKSIGQLRKIVFGFAERTPWILVIKQDHWNL